MIEECVDVWSFEYAEEAAPHGRRLFDILDPSSCIMIALEVL